MVETDPAALAARRAELLARLHAGGEGAWLSPYEVAVLFPPNVSTRHVEPTTVHRWIVAEKISYTESPGGHRRCNPEDVLELLRRAGEVRRGGDTHPPTA